jgi:hypothetical protein
MLCYMLYMYIISAIVVNHLVLIEVTLCYNITVNIS